VRELPVVREEFGFRRTHCGCAFCQAPCRHLPGALAPSDLPRLCPPGREVFAWAEEHLRALRGKPYPILVPARRQDGVCHWYFDGTCAVHASAPYGCAFFDAHMPQAESNQRFAALVEAIRQDVAANGLYYRIWLHLRQQGLTGTAGHRADVVRELERIARRAEGNRTKSATVIGHVYETPTRHQKVAMAGRRE